MADRETKIERAREALREKEQNDQVEAEREEREEREEEDQRPPDVADDSGERRQ